MKKIIKISAFFLCFILAAYTLSYSKTVEISRLVDNFQKGTDLQREQILSDNLGKEVSGAGIVSNAGEYDFFDIVSDLKGTYYQVTTEQQKTKNNIPYQLIFLFRDKDKVKDIDKGQKIRKDGKIIKIEDERLQIAVWLFCGELSKEDKILFQHN